MPSREKGPCLLNPSAAVGHQVGSRLSLSKAAKDVCLQSASVFLLYLRASGWTLQGWLGKWLSQGVDGPPPCLCRAGL